MEDLVDGAGHEKDAKHHHRYAQHGAKECHSEEISRDQKRGPQQQTQENPRRAAHDRCELPEQRNGPQKEETKQLSRKKGSGALDMSFWYLHGES